VAVIGDREPMNVFEVDESCPFTHSFGGQTSDADRDEGGKYTATVTDEAILAAIDHAPGPVDTTADLEAVLPIGRRAIRERLLDLLDQDRVARKTVGGRAVVWWRASHGGTDAPDGARLEDDPVFDLPTFASGAGHVSANVDEYVADAIQAGDLPYRPLYTTGYILAELVTLGLARANYTLAATALRRVRASPSVTVLHPDEPMFAAVCDELYRDDDQDISLVDHATGVLADERDVEHVFTFDPEDFRTLGFTVVPDDTGEV
jgi:predicted nucleic acid-binding protein